MKLVKYSFLAAVLFSATSCLKSKSDWGGIRDDEGSIVTSISEAQYINTDLQNIGFHFTGAFANVSFSTPNEPVKFFTLKVSQARDKKMSGNMTVKVTTANIPGFDPLPAGAVTFTDITVPQNSANVFEYPVSFTVNKALLNPANWYAVRITLDTASQGAVNAVDGSVDVLINADPAFNTSRYTGRYIATTTIQDSLNILGINNNTRPYILSEGRYDPFFTGSASLANHIYPTDLQIYGLGSTTAYSLYAVNRTTGAQTQVVQPVYRLDASGKVIDVLNRSTLASLNPTFDNSVSNQFTVTSNSQRTLNVKYSVRLTVGGVTRRFTITDSYTYDPIQVFF